MGQGDSKPDDGIATPEPMQAEGLARLQAITVSMSVLYAD